MSIFDRIFKPTVKENKPVLGPFTKGIIREQKGQVETGEGIRPELGEDHPFDFQEMEDIYTKFSMVTGAINKTVDQVVGSNHFIETDNPELEKVLEEFMDDRNYDLLLRTVVRDVLVYGNSFVEIVTAKANGSITELRILSPKFMYIRREESGKVIGYVQRTEEMKGMKKSQEPIQFGPLEIAHFKLNVIGDSAYGLSIIEPLKIMIKRQLSMEDSMTILMERKANSPMIIKLGDADHEPVANDINAIGQDLEVLTSKTEWVFPYTTDVSMVNFGPIGEKFAAPLDHTKDQIIFGIEVPEVLLGKGSIPEGLAKVQMDAFENRVESIRLNIDEVNEKQILQRVADQAGFQGEKFNFKWEPRSEEDKWQEVDKITLLLQSNVVPQFNIELQKRLAELLEIEPDKEEEIPTEKVRGNIREAWTEEEATIYLNELEKLEVDKVEWVTIGDSRTCPICIPQDAKVFNINEIREAKLKIPAHNNCRCRYIPFFEVLRRTPEKGSETGLGKSLSKTIAKKFLKKITKKI